MLHQKYQICPYPPSLGVGVPGTAIKSEFDNVEIEDEMVWVQIWYLFFAIFSYSNLQSVCMVYLKSKDEKKFYNDTTNLFLLQFAGVQWIPQN